MATFKRIPIWFFGLSFPPLAIGLLIAFSHLSSQMLQKTPEALEGGLALEKIAPPPLTGKPRAAVLISNDGTQITELLGPYQILAESGLFDVFTVGPQRVLSPTTGSVAVLPHYSFTQAPAAELVVIPAVLNPMSPELIQWTRTAAARAKLVLVVCEGARLAFQAGLLRDIAATSHFLALPDLRKLSPETRWVSDQRYVDAGKLITSAGVTASLDAALHAVERFSDSRTASLLARKVGLRWNRENDPAAREKHELGKAPPKLTDQDLVQIFFRSGFDWFRTRAGILLAPGMDELALAPALDTLARSQSIDVFSLGAKRGVLRTRNGLDLVPLESAMTAGPADLLLVAGGRPAEDALRDPEIKKWVGDFSVSVKSFSQFEPGQVWDETFALLGLMKGPWSRTFAAKMTEYPLNESRQSSALASDWPLSLWLRPLLIGILSLSLTLWLERRFRKLRSRRN